MILITGDIEKILLDIEKEMKSYDYHYDMEQIIFELKNKLVNYVTESNLIFDRCRLDDINIKFKSKDKSIVLDETVEKIEYSKQNKKFTITKKDRVESTKDKILVDLEISITDLLKCFNI